MIWTAASEKDTASTGFEVDAHSFGIPHSGFVMTSAPRLALRGIKADFGPEYAATFRYDFHPDLRVNYVLATAERDSAFLIAKPNRRACLRQDNPMPFNDSDTALRGNAFLQSEAKPQVVSEAKDNFRKDDDVRWQPSGARSTAKGSPQGERGGVHQFGVPPKGNANFA